MNESTDMGGRTNKAGAANWITGVTAIVGALAALLVALGGLVVTADQQWNKVGPLILKWIHPTPQSTTQATAHGGETTSPLRALLPPLESADTAQRRAARTALAAEIARASPADVHALIAAVPSASYRGQLGIAVALAQAKGGWRSSDTRASAQALRDQAGKTADATLKAELLQAAAAGRP